VLSIAKIEAGRLALDERTFDLGRLIDAVNAIVSVRAEAKGLALAFAVEAGLPPAVTGDEGKLRQVLINLLGNAVKFTSTGRIALRARWREGIAEFEVADTGHGIAPDELPRIFDRLFRGDRSRAERGLGLGLSLVKAIVEAHGGSVEVESEIGRGSTFIVSLPLPRDGTRGLVPSPFTDVMLL